MAATYVKFNQFVEDLAGKVHDLFGTSGSTADVCKVYLSNASPNTATNAIKADLAEISNANGYAAPVTIAHVTTRTTTTVTMTGTNVTVTASGGTVGPFQYVVLYNDTPTSPADPLIAYWDYGSALTLQDGESFTIKFNSGVSSGTVFTLSMKPCCLEASNLVLQRSEKQDVTLRVCKVCGCKHYDFDAAPIRVGVTLKG